MKVQDVSDSLKLRRAFPRILRLWGVSSCKVRINNFRYQFFCFFLFFWLAQQFADFFAMSSARISILRNVLHCHSNSKNIPKIYPSFGNSCTALMTMQTNRPHVTYIPITTIMVGGFAQSREGSPHFCLRAVPRE